MLKVGFVAGIVSSGLAIAGAALAQNYPNKPIRIVAGPAGGGTDIPARLIAQALAGSVGQPVIVDNRPAGVIPAEIVAKAAADGYTLLYYNAGMWILPLMQSAPYDAVKDFAPITLAITAPNILVVPPALAANSVKELIALARAKPGELNYASTGAGAATHLAAELFNSMAGVNIVRVNYKGTPTAIVDLIGGQVQLLFINVVTVTPHVKSGKLKALAITSELPSALFPGLPTVAASGLTGYESSTRQGVFAPAKTPQPIVERINREIVRVLHSADMKERASRDGGETIGSSPHAFAAIVKSEMVKWAKVIKNAGIKAE